MLKRKHYFMNAKFSERIRNVLSYSKEEALRLNNSFVGTEHLFLGILKEGKGLALDALIGFGVDFNMVKKSIEASIASEEQFSENINVENIPLLKSSERALKLVYLEARSMNDEEVDTEHLLLAILKDKNSIVTETLSDYNVDYQYLKDELYSLKPHAQANTPDEDDDEDEDDEDEPERGSGSSKSTSETPVLDNFGIDLTKAAEEKKLDPIVGRDSEIERLVQILSRRKKNNPLLIGEPGVGKSAIAEGLAMRIINKKVSRVLFDKRIVTLDLASIVAGTKYRGQFEERMKSILNEIAKTDKVILFIDEIHTIVGAGGASGSLDAANMLKPALARGEIQCIGATTLDDYRQNIEKDGALERRFQKVMIDPTNIEESIEILHNIKERYEDHHNVIYSDKALKACVHLTNRYISDRHLPDKAIDALDEAGSRVHISNIKVPKEIKDLEAQIEDIKSKKINAVKMQNFELAASHRDKEQELTKELEREKEKWQQDLMKNREQVTEANVEEVVSMMTGIPVQRIAQAEGQRLMKMKDEITGSIIGQEEAVKKVVRAIQRNRAGLKDPNKPIGSFVFLGPTGVGKTQLAKVISNYLFEGNDSLIRLDMSEYMEKFSVSRLVGAPPGYVGYEEGGQLTEKVRHRPYSVVLLDELEKAHPDVFNILLQILDEGHLTDSLGRNVDFRNTIIIMTSNIGTRDIKDFDKGIGFATSTAQSTEEYHKGLIQKALKKAFAPEFLNRIDDVVVFNSLKREHIFRIIDIELRGLHERVNRLEYSFELTDKAKEFLVDKGYDEKYGARPLQRAIQKYVEDEMAEVIIEHGVDEGDKLVIDREENEEKLKVIVHKNQAALESEKEQNAISESSQDSNNSDGNQSVQDSEDTQNTQNAQDTQDTQDSQISGSGNNSDENN